jgi:hypothetical protein
MADLRREVAQRLRETLHGREIDTMEKGMPELPHMLGIVTIGAISTPEAISGSLLDCDHSFWDTYYEDVNTKGKVEREIESALHSLKEDEIFRVSTPYGEEAGIWYCEVGEVEEQPNRMLTVCTDCGESIPTEPELKHRHGRYTLEFKLDCPECDFSANYESNLTRR